MARAQPERTCVGCRRRAPKAELLRLSFSPREGVRVDPTAPGRGAYLHRDAMCLDAALKARSIARALRTDLGPDGAVRLRSHIESMGAL